METQFQISKGSPAIVNQMETQFQISKGSPSNTKSNGNSIPDLLNEQRSNASTTTAGPAHTNRSRLRSRGTSSDIDDWLIMTAQRNRDATLPPRGTATTTRPSTATPRSSSLTSALALNDALHGPHHSMSYVHAKRGIHTAQAIAQPWTSRHHHRQHRRLHYRHLPHGLLLRPLLRLLNLVPYGIFVLPPLVYRRNLHL